MFILTTTLLMGLSQPALAERFVILGDSLTCGSFGQNLLRELTQKGHDVTIHCAVSSAPRHWLERRKPQGQICQTISSRQPSLQPCGGTGEMPDLSRILPSPPGSARVIVALGTNSLGSKSADASYRNLAVLASNGHRCDWIAPPQLNPTQTNPRVFRVDSVREMSRALGGFYDSLRDRVGESCRLIDSRNATAPGTAGHETTDGVHRTREAGRYWAQELVDSIIQVPSTSPTGSAHGRETRVN